MKSVSYADPAGSASSVYPETHWSPMLRTGVRLALTGVFGLMLSGCAITQLGSMFGSSNEEITGSIDSPVITQERSLSMAAKDMAPGAVGAAAGTCPPISIWQNDAHLTVYEIGRVGDNMAIKHRGEITKTARECEITPDQVTVKYGVAGRVLLGPLGESGMVNLPILIHVTDRTREKIKTSKLNVTVNMEGGRPYGNFSTVQRITFPVEQGVPASQYKVYIAFDRNAPGAG